MHFLPDVYVPCDLCHGKRYNRETLEITLQGGHQHRDVLEMTVEDAPGFFSQCRAIAASWNAGGRGPVPRRIRAEPDHAVRRRGAAAVKLSKELAPRHRAHALHPRRADHRPAVSPTSAPARGAAQTARREHGRGDRTQPRRDQDRDWVIDLGPDGGHRGERIIAEGHAGAGRGDAAVHTGHFLIKSLGTGAKPTTGAVAAPNRRVPDEGGKTAKAEAAALRAGGSRHERQRRHRRSLRVALRWTTSTPSATSTIRATDLPPEQARVRCSKASARTG